MENKKFNLFAVVMIIVMAMFTIYTTVIKDGARDGRDGLSAYELALKYGDKSKSEFEWIQSLYGKDGSNVTLDDVYEAYIKASGKNKDTYTFTNFILDYYPDKIMDADETATAVQSATQSALRSTVDICYSFCLSKPIVYYLEKVHNGKPVYQIVTDSNYYNRYASIGISAGAGVIYQIEGTETPDKSDDVAYIITNYHVVYAANYVSDESSYRVYNKMVRDIFNEFTTTNQIITATYDEADLKTYNGVTYIEKDDLVEAPIETHFLNDYGIYLYGYQSAEYELSASFVGGSAENDIAVLKIERTKTANNELLFEGGYKEVSLGNSKDLDIGEQVIAVGNPLLPDVSNVNETSGAQVYVNDMKKSYVDALCLTSTSGDVSNVSEYCKFNNLIDSSKSVDMRLIRVSAAINSGNSGGGLYDISGRLVGIVNGKIASQDYDNVGFAIPVNIAANLADKIIAECNGTKTRVYALKGLTTSIGLTVKNGNSDTYFDPNINGGVWVVKNNVLIDSISGTLISSGLNVGDVISAISFNDEETKYELTQDYDFNDILLKAKTNSTQKIILHILDGVDSTIKFEINISNEMFVEII